MANYNSKLQSNNTELQTILETINALPDASGGSGCECKKLYIRLTFSDFYRAEFSMPIEEIYALTSEELEEYEIIVMDNKSYYNVNRVDKSSDSLEIRFADVENSNQDSRLIEHLLRIYKDDNGKYTTNINTVAIQTLYRIPEPTTQRKKLIAENNSYRLVDDTAGGGDEETTENLILTVYDLGDGRLEFEEGYQGITPSYILQNGDMNVIMGLSMIVGEVAGDKQIAKFYKFATIDLETYDITFANGYNNPIHWAADGSLSYAPLFVNYEEVNF